MASAQQCEHRVAADKVWIGRCETQTQPPDSRMCEGIPGSGGRTSDSKIVDEKDRSKSRCHAVDVTSTACRQCHKWLHKSRFERHIHVAIATVNWEEGSLLQTSEVRNLIHCQERGCQLCSTVLGSIRLQIKVEWPEQEPLSNSASCSLYLLQDVPGWTIKVAFQAPLGVLRTDIRLVLCDIESENRRALDLTNIDDGETRICFQRPHESCAYQLDTQFNVAQIKTWLEECKSSHQSYCGRREGCGEEGDTFRLIFLGDEEQPRARLVDVDTLDSKTEYVTVSHRWDSSTKATETTQTNIANAYHGILLDAYPPDFRDIMSLTRRLGFNYIWIDSVCIIQDSREDWSKQATLMHHIYSNGTLNFALLEDFTHQDATGQVYAAAEVLGCNLRILDTSRELICWKPENFDYVLQKSNLYSRGWTFQERLLSPRTVHFGKQLCWECCLKRASTTFPLTVDYPGQFADNFVLTFKQLINTPISTQGVAGKLHGIWCSLVRDYSRRDFTKPSDIHIALTGVVKRLQYIYSLGDDDYIYGLWKPCLPEQLLWGVEGTTRVNLNQSSAGPSWSWVSHLHSTKFVSIYLGTESLRQRLATFIGFYEGKEKTPSGNMDVKSSTRSAALILKGILIPFDNRTSIDVAIELDCSMYESCSGTYLLPIMGDLGTVYGLVIQSASNEEHINPDRSSTFRRLGLFQGWQTTIEKNIVRTTALYGIIFRPGYFIASARLYIEPYFLKAVGIERSSVVGEKSSQ